MIRALSSSIGLLNDKSIELNDLEIRAINEYRIPSTIVFRLVTAFKKGIEKKKIEKLRIFEDSDGKMNLSVEDEGGQLLIVSQFTLYGDARKGNRPSFIKSSNAKKAEEYYEMLIKKLKDDGFDVNTGKFQTHMEVSLINDGPVTIQLDSERLY